MYRTACSGNILNSHMRIWISSKFFFFQVFYARSLAEFLFFLHEEPLHSATPHQRVCRARRLFGKNYGVRAIATAVEKFGHNCEHMAATVMIPTILHYNAACTRLRSTAPVYCSPHLGVYSSKCSSRGFKHQYSENHRSCAASMVSISSDLFFHDHRREKIACGERL